VQVSGIFLGTRLWRWEWREFLRLGLEAGRSHPFIDPFQQRITSPLTVAHDLRKCRVA
jgi:hypothetical protein